MQISTNSAVLSEEFEEDFRLKLNLNEDTVDEKKPEEDEEEFEDEEEEFSFVCMNPDGSPISADDIFQDGQIRPFYPLFDRVIRQRLEKAFVEERDGGDCASSVSSSEAEDTEGPYCRWATKAVEDSGKASCRKSNSTGFSKLRRFREMILRSTSDGKDAFIFLHHDHHHGHNKSDAGLIAPATASKAEKSEKETEVMKSVKRPPKSAHERLYVQNRATKEEHKRKSYLPYRVGFFTRNVHPY